LLLGIVYRILRIIFIPLESLDASDEKAAAVITNFTCFKAKFAVILADSRSILKQVYAFTNRIADNGIFGFKLPVVHFTSL
jgi:hypothetical protein